MGVCVLYREHLNRHRLEPKGTPPPFLVIYQQRIQY